VGDANHQVVVDLKDAPVHAEQSPAKAAAKTDDDVDFKEVSVAEALDILKVNCAHI
jgi:hypothetical protein